VGGDEVPIIAPPGVHEVIRRDDPVKEQILRPMFGDEWPTQRTFPNQTIADGESVSFDGATFTVVDLGPSESPHDSPWLLDDDARSVFLGDQIYDRMHSYLADGYYEQWLANIDRLKRELPADAALHVGHGGPVERSLFDWQARYIETFVAAVREADWSNPDAARASVIARVKEYLPGEGLQFLMELSIDPVATKMGFEAAS
jgi:glyoxylase-like metal-dependent hydrolase (beta-lactamase superfamily II)